MTSNQHASKLFSGLIGIFEKFLPELRPIVVHWNDGKYWLFVKGEKFNEEELNEDESEAIKHFFTCRQLQIDTFYIVSSQIRPEILMPSSSYTIDAVGIMTITQLNYWYLNIDQKFMPKEICFKTTWTGFEQLGDDFVHKTMAFWSVQFKATVRLVMSSFKFTLDNDPNEFNAMLKVFSRQNVRDFLCHIFSNGIILSISVLKKESFTYRKRPLGSHDDYPDRAAEDDIDLHSEVDELQEEEDQDLENFYDDRLQVRFYMEEKLTRHIKGFY